MTREITHMKALSLALESMSKPAFSIGRIAPTPGLVDQFFNDSTGTGDHGEIDTRGPWNESGDWVFTESPAIQAGEPGPATAIVTESSPPAAETGLGDLLLFRTAWQIGAGQALQGHDGARRGRSGNHRRGRGKEDAAADLALIGAAQRVEHYEIAGYTTARNLAQQLRHSAIVGLLSKSLAEEEHADQLLNQVARSLMSVAKMPAAVEQTE
jgi:Mn-containing catalase